MELIERKIPIRGSHLYECPVMKYANSSRLVAKIVGQGQYLDLGSDYAPLGKPPHGVNAETVLHPTGLIVEIEIKVEDKCIEKIYRYRLVRIYHESDKPERVVHGSRDQDDNKRPLEERINISPSEKFTSDESRYIGQIPDPPISYWVATVIGLVILGVGVLGDGLERVDLIWGGAFFALGGWQFKKMLRYKKQLPEHEEQIAARTREVEDAKRRARDIKETRIEKMLSDFCNWESMSGVEFESAVSRLYRQQGYEVHQTSTTGDGGVDLVLKKGDEKAVVQCKRYNKNVGVGAVRELNGIKPQWPDASRFILVGVLGFTNPAKTFAKDHGVELFSIKHDHFKLS
ncbi:MAG: restriction endonuclease [Desulfovibrionaceae bacterium]|nr:restriction endonuclease [Desulfovibrionaceae bacterium]